MSAGGQRRRPGYLSRVNRGLPLLSIRTLTAAAIEAARLDLAPGEAVVLTGPSGGGKSRLLRAIADLDPNEAEITLDGRPRESFTPPEWRRRVGFVPAETGWWADTVAAHMPEGDARPLVEALGLPGEALDWDVARLSTGEKHRLAIVRALLTDPAYLLLDEPSAALDEKATALLEALLAERKAAGLGLLVVTHDRAQADRLADRERRIEAGRLLPAEDAS